MTHRDAISDGWAGGSQKDHYQGYVEQARRERARKQAAGIVAEECRICGTTMKPGRRVCPGCGREK